MVRQANNITAVEIRRISTAEYLKPEPAPGIDCAEIVRVMINAVIIIIFMALLAYNVRLESRINKIEKEIEARQGFETEVKKRFRLEEW